MKLSKKVTAGIGSALLISALFVSASDAATTRGGHVCAKNQYVLTSSYTPNKARHVHEHTSQSGQYYKKYKDNTTSFGTVPGWYRSTYVVTTDTNESVSASSRCIFQ